MMANSSSAAVEDIEAMASMTMSPMPRPAPAKRPKIVGTRISARMGESFLVMISVMKTTIMAKPRMTVTGAPPSAGVLRSARCGPTQWGRM